MATIEIEGITKMYGDLVAVDDASLTVRSGELLCLLGPSGCGKSTTLRCIAGLEVPTEGSVSIAGEDVTNLGPYDRDCAMVFQSWALFPYKSVLENVTFGLKMKGVDKAERIDRAREILEMVNMTQFEDSNPTDLSGGQKQRVALARSVAMDPSVLLLDEPLSNLDKRLKEDMQIELRNIHQQLDKTMVHVTHDQNEAFTLADRIVIMNDGHLVQIGTPREVYSNPKNLFVEEFLGDSNFLSGTVSETDADSLTADLSIDQQVTFPLSDAGTVNSSDSITVSIRPEVMEIESSTDQVRASGGEERQHVSGTVKNILYRGSTVRYYVEVAGDELFVEQNVAADEQFDEGQSVTLSWDRDDLLCFDREGNTIWT
ncbi:MAG: ABC transporter ATP-binding protein [Halobacteriales archaeon]|nr:ABC transporter ATP-binding protein [Halobacteriales archaeon]